MCITVNIMTCGGSCLAGIMKLTVNLKYQKFGGHLRESNRKYNSIDTFAQNIVVSACKVAGEASPVAHE